MGVEDEPREELLGLVRSLTERVRLDGELRKPLGYLSRGKGDIQMPVATAPETAVERSGVEVSALDPVLAELGDCRRCPLGALRRRLVFGEGNPGAELVFVGEAPGADEDAQGRPFVGRAGQLLTKIIAAMGLKREDVYICNILKDRPPNNRTPNTEEMNACSPLLERQLAMLHPKIIALLGNTSIKYAIGPDAPGITKIHGQWFTSIFGIPCMPLYHPSYLLRYQARTTGSPNWQMWQDIQTLKKRYDELCGA